MSNLVDFLSKLGSDPATLKEYEADPEATMTRAGLTTEEQQAILTGDASKVAKLAGVSSVHMIKTNITSYEA